MKQVAVSMIFVIALAGAGAGQEKKESRKRVVVVPPQIASPVIAYQPDCPLRIEDIKLFQFVSGGGGTQSVQVRNIGNKPIRSYTIGTWNSVGTGWEVERKLRDNLLPGDVSGPQENEVEVQPLTEDLRRQLNLNGEAQAIVVFVIIRVEFVDGSVYDNEPLYKTLKAHFDKLSV